ncbi:MAG TPA: hypothetical protein VK210_12735, partial [Terriglobia bacterium]|nr:hypothetical protein [Terriglobia bacterium]
MISSVPKFRQDLIIRCRQTAGTLSFVVKDPISGNFFRLGEAEEFIAQQLDGETTLDVIRKRVEERFEAVLPVEMLRAFIRKLEKTDLLETGQRRSRVSNPRLQGNPLYLRYKLFDPSRLFVRLRSPVECFYSPQFLVLSAVLILLAVGISISNWNRFLADLPRLYGFSAVLIFITLAFLVVSAHEFAHGLTCTHYGGEVHEIGFLLIYFQPALYCNVSDSWLFPEKKKRLWVGIAGPYFELFLWALAVIAWRVADHDTWLNYAGLMVMTSSGIKTLLNLNPMMKFDGYYLLSDYLEIPNLRRKAFRYVGQWIKRVAGFGAVAEEMPPQSERRTLFLYGLLATGGSFIVL